MGYEQNIRCLRSWSRKGWDKPDIIYGVSRWGKAAAVADAFDKRIKVTAPSCSGQGNSCF